MKSLASLFRKADTCSSCQSVRAEPHQSEYGGRNFHETDFYCDQNDEYGDVVAHNRKQLNQWKKEHEVWEDSICDDYEKKPSQLDERGLE
jgi:hypothetical protein